MGKKNPLQDLDPDHISELQLKQIYNVLAVPCKRGACRRNCVSNARCLNGLGECQYNRGVDIVESNKYDYIRSENEYVGLKNLGATCYVNSYLQVWMHNPVSHNVILSQELSSDIVLYEPECTNANESDGGPRDLHLKTENDLLLALQAIFVLLQHSKRRVINPNFFVQALQLDETTHQDAQEFSSLFLILLEKQLIAQGRQNFVSKLFQGHLLFNTRCLSCQATSSTDTAFTELQLPVQGFSSLQQSLDAFFQAESLEGENQYSCCTCHEKSNATRTAKLVNAGDILTIQMMRFVYDRQKEQKKKLSTRIKFPMELDISPYMTNDSVNQSEEDRIYDLTAVVLHIGRSTAVGHFVVQVRCFHSASDEWLEFDDHNVKQIFRRRRVGEQSDDKSGDDEPKRKSRRFQVECPSTTNGYMFMYTRRSALKHHVGQLNVGLSEQMKKVLDMDNVLVDDWLKSQQNVEQRMFFDKVCDVVDSMFNDSEQLFFVNLRCLRDFYEDPSSAKFFYKRCPHNLVGLTVPVHSPNRMRKLLPLDTVRLLDQTFPQSESLEASLPKVDDICRECVKEYCRYLRCKAQFKNDQKMLQIRLRSALGLNTPNYYVGRKSLKQWQSIKMAEVTPSFMQNKQIQSDTDVSEVEDDEGDVIMSYNTPEFNDDLICEHKQLTPFHDRKCLVANDVWQFFRKLFPTAKEWPADSEVCSVCKNNMEESAREERELKEIALEERFRLSELVASRNLPLPASAKKHTIYLLSCEFFDDWRRFMRNPKSGRPALIRNQSLMCMHGLLSFCPVLPNNRCVWVRESDWIELTNRYKFDRAITIDYQPSDNSDSAAIYNPDICQLCLHADLTNKAAETEIEVYICRPCENRRRPTGRSSAGRLVTIKVRLSDTVRDIKMKVAGALYALASDQHLMWNDKELEEFDSDGQPMTAMKIPLTNRCRLILQTDSPLDTSELNVSTEADTSCESVEKGFKGTALSS